MQRSKQTISKPKFPLEIWTVRCGFYGWNHFSNFGEIWVWIRRCIVTESTLWNDGTVKILRQVVEWNFSKRIIFRSWTLMEETKPVVTEKIQFEYRDKPISSVLAFLEISEKQDSHTTIKINDSSIQWFTRAWKIPNGSLMDEIKQVVMKRKS